MSIIACSLLQYYFVDYTLYIFKIIKNYEKKFIYANYIDGNLKEEKYYNKRDCVRETLSIEL